MRIPRCRRHSMRRRWRRTSERSTTSTGRVGIGPKRGFGAEPRQAMRFLTALIVCAGASSAIAVEPGPQPPEPYVPDTVHRENGVVWRSGFRTIHDRYVVNLVNESARPIQCRVTFG